jgi:hypothetical protein
LFAELIVGCRLQTGSLALPTVGIIPEVAVIFFERRSLPNSL